MKRSKWIACILAFAMIAGTGVILVKFKGRHPLGKPGVAVAQQSILLPDQVLDGQSVNVPISRAELDALPKDTTISRRLYRFSDGLAAQLTVVLMGSDRTSIHQPEYCLIAQNWSLNKKERVLVPMDRPVHYDLPVNKLSVSNVRKDKNGEMQNVSGIYVYWFVSGDKITADPLGGMMWSLAKTLIQNGTIERWAYISYFCAFPPGEDAVAFNRLQEFIRASAPQFQLVAGKPNTPLSAANMSTSAPTPN